jgi:hypothetical protein
MGYTGDFNLDHSVDLNADYCYNPEQLSGEDPSLLYGLREPTTAPLTSYPASCEASTPPAAVASPELASSRSGSLSFSRSSSFSVPGLAPRASSPSLADVFLRGPSAEKDALQQYLNGLAATMTGKRQRDEDEKDKKKRKRRTTKRTNRPAASTTSPRKRKAQPAAVYTPAAPVAVSVQSYTPSFAPVPAPSPIMAPPHYYTDVFYDAPASCVTAEDDEFWKDVEALHSDHLEASSLRDAFFNSSFSELEQFLLENDL